MCGCGCGNCGQSLGAVAPEDLLDVTQWSVLEQYADAMTACGFSEEQIREAMFDLNDALVRSTPAQYSATIAAWGQVVRDVCETGSSGGVVPSWAPEPGGSASSPPSKEGDKTEVRPLLIGAGAGAALGAAAAGLGSRSVGGAVLGALAGVLVGGGAAWGLTR